jgi:hypothetical protein
VSRCARCGAEIALVGETCARCGFVSEVGAPPTLGPAPAGEAPAEDPTMGWIITVAVLIASALMIGAAVLWVFGERANPDVAGAPLIDPTTTVRRVPGTATTTIAPRRPPSTTTTAPGGPLVPTVPDPGAGSVPAAAWKHYSSPDGALEADFPAVPTTSVLRDVTTCAISGNQVQQDDGQSVYLVTYGLNQSDCNGTQLTSELLHAAVGTLGPSGQVLNVREGRLEDHTMTTFDLSAGTNDVRGRGAIIVTAGHYFLVIAAGPARATVEFERFLSSLRVT